MKIIALTTVALAIASVAAAQPAGAKEFGRSEKSGDMNIFQVEPSILNERFYTSGKAERQQYCGKVLPAGAPIPDNDAPLSEQSKPAPKEVKETPSATTSKESAVKPSSEDSKATSKSEDKPSAK